VKGEGVKGKGYLMSPCPDVNRSPAADTKAFTLSAIPS
jgi:hypothetical protein